MFLDKKYTPLEFNKQNDFTAQKQTRFLLDRQQGSTIRKRLFDDPTLPTDRHQKHQVDQQNSLENTLNKQNKHKYNGLDTDVVNYKPQKDFLSTYSKTKFTTLVLPQTIQKQQKNETFSPYSQNISKEERINQQLRTQQLLKKVKNQLSQEPRHRVSRVDKEITQLYKQNKNVNLQCRTQKFLKIFLGKGRHL